MVLAQVVVAMRGTRAAKVECKTCKEVHAYRKSKPKSQKTSIEVAIEDYEAMVATRDPKEAVKYKMTAAFEADTLLKHKKFGVGLVTALHGGDKMEVLFENGRKILVHSREL